MNQPAKTQRDEKDEIPFSSALQETQLQLRNCQNQLKAVTQSIDLLMDNTARERHIEAAKAERISIQKNMSLNDRKRKRLLSDNQKKLRELGKLNNDSVAHILFRNEYELQTRMTYLTAELANIHQMKRQLQQCK